MSESQRRTVTGRRPGEPVIQNLPGSLAHALSWAFERNDFRIVWSMVAAMKTEAAPDA